MAGGELHILAGRQNDLVPEIAAKTGAITVFWNRRYAPYQISADKALKTQLNEDGIEVSSFNGRLLFEPWKFKTGSGGYYKVFTPLWKAMKSRGVVRSKSARVAALTGAQLPIKSLSVDELKLLPTAPNWALEFENEWTPGETGAVENLENFLRSAVSSYKEGRNRPDKRGTSRLSPHLQQGEISPVQIWHAVQDMVSIGEIPADQADVYLSEIAWREFSYVLLFHNPDMMKSEIREQFKSFPWLNDSNALEAWQTGQTGYPIVDAGMRQLWRTGWMHNRVRMIVGSFLVKHLLVDWRQGMNWFWDTLVDADIAANTASWQWIAGCGADASPYFRIFNPMSQGDKFDPNGSYVREFVPELSKIPIKYIHQPWEAPVDVLETAGVTLGEDYPRPIVEHKRARERALAAYAQTKT
jgi:deoxyribodipyrimidine photo-lyase